MATHHSPITAAVMHLEQRLVLHNFRLWQEICLRHSACATASGTERVQCRKMRLGCEIGGVGDSIGCRLIVD